MAADSLNEMAKLRIKLVDTDTLIWRQVEVPTSITLKGSEIVEWLDGYDPDTIDELVLKIALSRIARRRNAAKATFAGKAKS